MVRRFATITLSLALVLGLSTVGRLLAQDEKKESAPAKADDAKGSAAAATKAEGSEEPLPTIPPEVEAKLEAARRAVAEAIVAAQDAGLVQTSIDPPPILDILITGRATDQAELKRKAEERKGVSPEVFGAWFTGFGKMEGITAQADVRIVQPSKGLTDWYTKRAEILRRHIEAVRKDRGNAPRPPDATKAETSKKAEAEAETPKAGEPKKDQPPTKDESKKDEPKAAAPKAETPKEEPGA